MQSIRTLFALAAMTAAAVGATPTKSEEFIIDRPHGKLAVIVQTSADKPLATDPMTLLNFSADRQSAMVDGKYGALVKPFLDQGHRVVSFDLPAHGERVTELGSGIAGMAAEVVAGKKPFDTFVEDAQATIDELIKRGLAKPGKIVVCGVSRAGYCALRLAAVDDRVAATAALAPVTDWRDLKEFAGHTNLPVVEQLALTNFAPKLAGKRFYVAIGNADTRVGTDACTRFILAVNEAEKAKGLKTSAVRYLMVDDSVDHSLNTKWRQEGIQFLLKPAVTAAVQQDLPK